MKVFFPQEALLATKNKYIFFDNCVLLDIGILRENDRKEIFDKLDLLLANGCVFGSVYPIYSEFCISFKESDLLKKKAFFEKIIEFTIPIRAIKTDIFDELIVEYSKYSRKTKPSFADLCLAAAIKQFPQSLLLTRNHSDFPLSLFNCLGAFLIHHDKEIRAYGFYEYGPFKRGKKKEEEPPF